MSVLLVVNMKIDSMSNYLDDCLGGTLCLRYCKTKNNTRLYLRCKSCKNQQKD